MKNQTKFLAILIITCLLLVSITSLIHAADTPNAGDAIGQQFGINTDQTSGLKENITNTYLKGEWGKIIASKPVIGPIHNYFTNHPLIFKILFNETYAISVTFLLIVIFWILVCSITNDSLRYTGFKKFSIPAGIAFAIILAHLNTLKFLATYSLRVLTSSET